MKKKFLMSAALMLLFGGMSASAKAVDFDINTFVAHHIMSAKLVII